MTFSGASLAADGSDASNSGQSTGSKPTEGASQTSSGEEEPPPEPEDIDDFDPDPLVLNMFGGFYLVFCPGSEPTCTLIKVPS